jgi:hypothetical protein
MREAEARSWTGTDDLTALQWLSEYPRSDSFGFLWSNDMAPHFWLWFFIHVLSEYFQHCIERFTSISASKTRPIPQLHSTPPTSSL